MTRKQALFVAEYRKDLNGKKAAIRAGYSEKSAEQQASTLLADPKVSEALADLTQKQLDDVGVKATDVLREIKRLAFSDVRGLFDEKGNLKPIHTLTDEQAAAIAGCEVIVKNAQAGDGHMDTVHKIKVWDKPKNLEMLAKHFGLLIERVEHSGAVSFTWEK